MASGALIVPRERSAVRAAGLRSGYRCECGHVVRVFGGGRHRLYFEPGGLLLDDPVMNRVCPACGHGLPGKNRP
jgi:hypothetical protein